MSLFYVASQIRRNSAALESSTNQAVTDSTQQRLLAPAANPALAAAMAKLRDDYEGLTSAEKVQLAFFSRATFRGIHNAFFQHRRGLLSESSRRDYESIIRMNLRRPDVPGWWQDERDSYEPEFAVFVDRLLAESSRA